MTKTSSAKKCRINVGRKYKSAAWWLNFCKAYRRDFITIKAFRMIENERFSIDEFYNNLLKPYNARMIMFGERQCIEFNSKKDFTFFVMKWS